MLNYVPCLPSCVMCFSCLRAHVPACLRPFASYVSSFFDVPLRASIFFTCFTCFPFFAYLTHLPLTYFTYLPTYLLTFYSYVPYLRVLYALIFYVPYVPSFFLRTLRAFHFLNCIQILTCLMCPHFFYKMWNNP